MARPSSLSQRGAAIAAAIAPGARSSSGRGDGIGWVTFEDSVRSYLQCPKPRVARWRQLNIQICQSSSQRRLTEGTRNRSENHRGHGRRGAVAQSAAAPRRRRRRAGPGKGRGEAEPSPGAGPAPRGAPRGRTRREARPPRGAEAAKPAPAPRTNPLSPRRDRAAREETPRHPSFELSEGAACGASNQTRVGFTAPLAGPEKLKWDLPEFSKVSQPNETPTKRFLRGRATVALRSRDPRGDWAPDWLRSCESLTQLCGTLILKLTVR